MKKFLSVIFALCSLTLFCCACNRSDNEPIGNSWARVTGIMLLIYNEELWVRSDDENIELSAEQSYVLEVALLRSGGSSPGYIEKEAISFEYDETAVDLIDISPDDPINYTFDLICLKTDVPITIKVTANSFSDEITFKVVD